MRLFQIFCQDPNLILHGQDDLFQFGVGLLSEDSLNPSGGRDYLLHGAASEFLDFRRQGAIDSAKKSVNSMALCRFIIARVQAFSKLFSFTCELHYFLGASLKLLKGCPGFISNRADAQAR